MLMNTKFNYWKPYLKIPLTKQLLPLEVVNLLSVIVKMIVRIHVNSNNLKARWHYIQHTNENMLSLKRGPYLIVDACDWTDYMFRITNQGGSSSANVWRHLPSYVFLGSRYLLTHVLWLRRNSLWVHLQKHNIIN